MAEEKSKTFVNNPQAVYKKRDISKAPGLNLRSAEWAVLTQVNGILSLVEIAEILSMDIEEISRIIRTLFQHGLVEVFQVLKKEEKYVDESFFQRLESTLTSIIGPVAPFVIEDALIDISINKMKFPPEKVPELIEMISDEILDDEKKIKFQQEMLEYIRKGII